MKRFSLLSLLFALLFISCGNVKEDKEELEQDSIPKDSIENKIVLNPFFNDISAYLAGKTLSAESHLAEFTQNSEWQNYAKEIDQSWQKFEEEKLSLINPWVDTEISDIQKESRHAFYPFSGPDFVYLYAFLDKSDYYYLFGLEPAGVVPDISKIGKERNSFFAALNNAIKDNLNLSFFITKSMKEQMNNEQIKGTIPVLLFFMARFDMHIQDIKAAEINQNGELVLKESENIEELNQTLKNIVEISFVKKGENTIKKLYYFSMNIRNDGFEKNPENEKYLRSLPKNMTSFVKSSSYCMHEEKYSSIRDIVLTHTKYLIQDDSGVPFRFFDNTNWDFSFYGEYSKPIPVFSQFIQEDYKKIFAAKKKPLNFRFGYSDPSNIFVAKKK
jgi:hypothetical protein